MPTKDHKTVFTVSGSQIVNTKKEFVENPVVKDMIFKGLNPAGVTFKISKWFENLANSMICKVFLVLDFICLSTGEKDSYSQFHLWEFSILFLNSLKTKNIYIFETDFSF